MNKALAQWYLGLDTDSKQIQCEYVWIDSEQGLKSKCRTLEYVPESAQDCPVWHTCEDDSCLRPVALFNDPFRRGNNKIVLCAQFIKDNIPSESNKRHSCQLVMDRVKDNHPWFGIEQEYTILDWDLHPYGWPKHGLPAPQGPYECGVGTNRAIGRDVVEAHYKCCIYAGLKIGGCNAETMPSQWEYQIGPCEGVEIGDQLWISRYLLHRVAEDFNVVICLDPKPVAGPWNGAGAHTNFSTLAMRENGGLEHIETAIAKLAKRHEQHLLVYDPNGGKDNARRLIGALSAPSHHDFKTGIADRKASVRIPRHVAQNRRGYLEDRRPSSNCDPYVVAEILVRTILLDE